MGRDIQAIKITGEDRRRYGDRGAKQEKIICLWRLDWSDAFWHGSFAREYRLP